MSDWGMWDLMVYNIFGNPYYDDRPCPDCGSFLDSNNTNYNAGTSAPGRPANLMYCDDDYHLRCGERDKNRERHPLTNERKSSWKHRESLNRGGVQNTLEWQSYLDDAEIKWNIAVKSELLNKAPAKEYFDWVGSQKESVVKQRVVSIKSRNSTQYTKLKELYNYTCQVDGCYETEVQFAHILKHSLPNSVDNHTNGWCMCCNHHNAYDSNRMIVEVNGDFVRYDVHGEKVEEGRIIYHDRHEVDPQFIILAREWHDDTKKQALG